MSFLGAAGTVTGSRFLAQAGGRSVLVDCGLFQGYKQLRARNRQPLPFTPADLDAVLLTHAHIDHSGYLPVLVRDGFDGPVFATAATRALCSHLLPDSGFIQEKDAEFANRHGFARHRPAKPLYTRADAERSLKRFRDAPFMRDFEPVDGMTARYSRAGHILGAASIRLEIGGTRVLFSGDLGHHGNPTVPPPDPPPDCDVLVVESTYGNRTRNDEDPENELVDVVRDTVGRGGTLVVPAFAVGRTQLLLYYLEKLTREQRIPPVPVFLDSPLAINATEVFLDHPNDHRLTIAQARDVCGLPRFVRDVEASKALDADPMPKIIIAGSGMATGGRVLHHLKTYAPDRRNTVLFTGYQAGGTRGSKMLAGVESIKIHGQYWDVRAQVRNLDMLSAHADRDELLDWMSAMARPPKQVYVVHGEAEAADALRHAIQERLGWPARVPEHGEQVALQRR
ncbi:MBL fold metallo-hydrolase [Halomonas denitrificans]|nr:MBL fold metallo-hydrolase [Halomonas denitrificans]